MEVAEGAFGGGREPREGAPPLDPGGGAGGHIGALSVFIQPLADGLTDNWSQVIKSVDFVWYEAHAPCDFILKVLP